MSEIPAWAVRGAKCICLRDLNARRPLFQGEYRGPYPNKGETLTVREVWSAPVPHATFDEYPASLGIRFVLLRPLVSTKTEAEDVAEFRKLLTQPIPEAV